MSAIGPGDWVECIYVNGGNTSSGGFRIGGLYEVTAVYPGPFASGAPYGLGIAGRPSKSPNGWRGDRFRPIYRPKQELIESLKAPPKRIKSPSREKATT